MIIHHDIKEVRQLGFTCYRTLLLAFSLEGRYTLFLFLLNNITHSGLLGWTVTQVNTLSAEERVTLMVFCR